jgi:hypothetical protein
MKVKFGMMMTDGRGKLGGQVASKNRSGNYVRTKVTPSNPQTAFQMQARAKLGSLSQGWRDLTESEKLAWNNAVDMFQKTDIFGDLRKPTGKNLFTGFNLNRFNVAATSVLRTPPSSPTPIRPVIGLVAEIDLATPEFQVEATLGTIATPVTGQVMIIEATAPMSAGAFYAKNNFRQIATVAITTGATAGMDILSAYQTRFGTIQAGFNYFVRVKIVSSITGEASPVFQTQVTFV